MCFHLVIITLTEMKAIILNEFTEIACTICTLYVQRMLIIMCVITVNV